LVFLRTLLLLNILKGNLPDPDWHHVLIDGAVWYYCKDEVVFNSHDGAPIIIPPFFLHDGGSIPWIFTSGLMKDGLMITGYALHDYTYKSDFPHDISRKHADKLLYEYSIYYGYPWYKRQAVYAGLKIGGWGSWKKELMTFYAKKTYGCKRTQLL
jgi:hypothetical protein